MKKVLILIVLPFFLIGCGGGGGDGTKPVNMKGRLYFSSKAKEAKVALVILDRNDNWVTASTSKRITHGSGEWNWGNFSLDLPIVDRNSVYGILPYDDTNKNNKFDELDEENLVSSSWLYAVYDANSYRWHVEDDNGSYYGQLPQYVVEIEADYSQSGVRSLGFGSTSVKSFKDSKAAFKTIKAKYNAN